MAEAMRRAVPVNIMDLSVYTRHSLEKTKNDLPNIEEFNGSDLVYMPAVDFFMLVSVKSSLFLEGVSLPETMKAFEVSDKHMAVLAYYFVPSHFGLLREQDILHRQLMAYIVLRDVARLSNFFDAITPESRDRLKTVPVFLHTACRLGFEDVADLLIERGFPVNDSYLGCSPLRVACQYGHQGMISFLIAKGAQIHAVEMVSQKDFYKPQRNNISSYSLLLIAMNYGSAMVRFILDAAGKSAVPAEDDAKQTALFVRAIEKYEPWVFEALDACRAVQELPSRWAAQVLECAASNSRLQLGNGQYFLRYLLNVPWQTEAPRDKVALMIAVSQTREWDDFKELAQNLGLQELTQNDYADILIGAAVRGNSWEYLTKIVPNPYEVSMQCFAENDHHFEHLFTSAHRQGNTSVVQGFLKELERDSNHAAKKAAISRLLFSQKRYLGAKETMALWPLVEAWLIPTSGAAKSLCLAFDAKKTDLYWLASALHKLTPVDERAIVFKKYPDFSDYQLYLILTQNYAWSLPWTFEHVARCLAMPETITDEMMSQIVRLTTSMLQKGLSPDENNALFPTIVVQTFGTDVLDGLLQKETRQRYLPIAAALLLQNHVHFRRMPVTERYALSSPFSSKRFFYQIFFGAMQSTIEEEQDAARLIYALLFEHLGVFQVEERLARKILPKKSFETQQDVRALFDAVEEQGGFSLESLGIERHLKAIHLLSQILFCEPGLYQGKSEVYKRLYTSVSPAKKLPQYLAALINVEKPNEKSLAEFFFTKLKEYAGYAPDSILPSAMHRLFSGKINHYGNIVEAVLKKIDQSFETLEDVHAFFTQLETYAKTKNLALYENPDGELTCLKLLADTFKIEDSKPSPSSSSSLS